MSHIPRSTSFPPAGPTSWRPGGPPCWRGFSTEPLLLQAEAAPVVWAADFVACSYARLGEPAGLSDMLSTVRSGPAAGAGTNGAYIFFDVDEPVLLPGLGLGIWGQFTALWANGNKPGVSPWANNSGASRTSTGEFKAGLFHPAIVNAAADYSANGYAGTVYTGSIAALSGSPITVRARYAPGDTGRFRVSLGNSTTAAASTARGMAGNLAAATALAGSIASVVNIEEAEGYTAIVTFVPDFTGPARICAGPDGNVGGSSEEGFIWGLDGVAGLVSPPWVSDRSPAPTRLATDHRIRGFAALAAAGDFSNGIGIAAKVDLLSLSRGTAATIAAFGEDAGNCVKLQIGTDNKVRLVIRHDGSDELDLVTGSAFATAGEKEISAFVVPGHFSLAATGLEGAESGAGVALPDVAATDPSVGSLWNTQHLQGVLKEMVLKRIAS